MKTKFVTHLVALCVAASLAGCVAAPAHKRGPVTPSDSDLPQLPPSIPAGIVTRQAATAARPVTSFVLPAPDPFLRTIAWCYPANELPGIMQFRIYQTTNLTPPVVWTFFTNVPAPALQVRFRGLLRQQFFIMTAVDFAGNESDYNVQRACE